MGGGGVLEKCGVSKLYPLKIITYENFTPVVITNFKIHPQPPSPPSRPSLGKPRQGLDVYPSNGQTLFQCHHYQLRPCSQLCMCRIATYNSVSRLSWSFVKEFIVSSYRLSYAQPCMLTHDNGSQQSYESYILTPG